jgi:hypothetical protein
MTPLRPFRNRLDAGYNAHELESDQITSPEGAREGPVTPNHTVGCALEALLNGHDHAAWRLDAHPPE